MAFLIKIEKPISGNVYRSIKLVVQWYKKDEPRYTIYLISKVALSFPSNTFHKTYYKELANIYYDKCF